MTRYLKLTIILSFAIFVAHSSFAQTRLEKALQDARQPRLTLNSRALSPLVQPGNQLFEAPPAKIYSTGLIFDITKRRFVNHTATRHLSLRGIERQRSQQENYFKRNHSYLKHWKGLTNLMPRYRLGF